MSNENDRYRNTMGDNDDDDEEYREAYLRALHQNRPRPRSGDTSQNDSSDVPVRRGKPRSGSGGRIYEESDDPPSRPRPTRQSRKEVEARLRQRPRQPVYSRNQEEEEPPRKKTNAGYQRPVPRRQQEDEYPYQQAPITRRSSSNYDDDEYEYEENPRAVPQRRRRHGRGRRAAKNVMVGCIGGVLTLAVLAGVIVYILLAKTPLGKDLNKLKYTRQSQQVLTTGNATQLIVKNLVGNISIRVDSKATGATLNSTKSAVAGSQEEANKIFTSITLTTKQITKSDDPDCLASTCLLVTGSVPSSTGSVLGSGNGNTLDLTINLPSTFADPLNPYTINADVTTGNITVNGFNGILDLSSNSAGSISVTNALIYAGSCLQTTSGNINVDKNSLFNMTKPSNLIPCTNKISTSGDQFWFHVLSGKGNIDLTLPAPNSDQWSQTNLYIDALANQGAIVDDFELKVDAPGDGSASYEGLLVPNNNTPAKLYLKASTGTITLHKK